MKKTKIIHLLLYIAIAIAIMVFKDLRVLAFSEPRLIILFLTITALWLLTRKLLLLIVPLTKKQKSFYYVAATAIVITTVLFTIFLQPSILIVIAVFFLFYIAYEEHKNKTKEYIERPN